MAQNGKWSPNRYLSTDLSRRPITSTPSLAKALMLKFDAWKIETAGNAERRIATSQGRVMEERVQLARTELSARAELAKLAMEAERREAAYHLAHAVLNAPGHIGRAILQNAIATERLFLEWDALRERSNATMLGLLPHSSPGDPDIEPYLDEQTIAACAGQLAAQLSQLGPREAKQGVRAASHQLEAQVGEWNAEEIIVRTEELLEDYADGISPGLSLGFPARQGGDEDDALDFEDW